MIDEYFKAIIHNILCVLSHPDLISDYVDIISTILTGVIAIIGISYIKPLKDKTLGATFTFWSQLRVRLIGIRVRLEADRGILKNIYSNSGEDLLPSENRINRLKADIEDTLDFIKKTPDQMPAYQGWSEDYIKLISLLEDCLVYDISDGENHFKQITDNNLKKDYQKELLHVINNICTEIDKRQKIIEKKIV